MEPDIHTRITGTWYSSSLYTVTETRWITESNGKTKIKLDK